MNVLGSNNINNPINQKPELGIVRELCGELIRDEINYCHWKSNVALNRSASGENDLDLLVSREDGQHFSEIMSKLGFKQVIKHAKYQLPGVLDYYGYDFSTERLVHVHTHYQLVLGHDATKNYHIPVEGPYLASSSLTGMFRVPSAEFELIILVIRMILKHSTWDTLLLGQGRLSSSERNELNSLVKTVSEIKMYEVLKEHFPFIDTRLFSACLHTMTSICPVWERIRIGQKLTNFLAPYARQPQIVDCFLKFCRRITWPLENRVFRREQRKQMNNGGLMTAVVGGDGSGKTTAVEEVMKWLSADFKILQFHMGKPKWSFPTYLIRGVLKIGRLIGFYPFERSEYKYTNDTNSLVFPGYPSLLRGICTAHDRYLTYIKARRFATNGGVVILDRFPLPFVKFMDGPHLARVTANIPRSKLLQSLINLEERYYRGMALPDLLIILRVDPETAVGRKTDESEESVRARSSEIWEKDWKQTEAYVIDANRSKEEVLIEVKQVIWSHL